MNLRFKSFDFKKIYYFLPLVWLIAISIIISIALTWYSSEEILSLIGVQNAYALMFLLAMIGGMSTFTGVPYHLILMSLAASGINPFWLGLVTALGVMLGDSTSFLIGKKSSGLLSDKLNLSLQKIAKYLEKRPNMIAPLLVLYGSISPFSNDFIVISMGLINYSYWKVIIPLTIGNILYNVGLAYVGFYAFESVQSWLF